MRARFPIVCALLLLASSARADVDHSAFDAVLRENVREERVDYENLKAGSLRELNGYLDRLADLDFATLGRDEQLAAYINLYNATMIEVVVDRYRPDYSPSENDFAVFKEPLVRLKGGAISLNDLENQVIRANFKEPRIHVALVCGARSCPPILPRAYRASDLNEVLAANMKRFVNDAYRNPIDVAGKRLRLSRIFDWYADDFGGKDKVAAFVGKQLGRDVSGWPVSFVEYSWELNRTP